MVGCIVEGQGDSRAVPILVRRIAKRLFPHAAVKFPIVVRRPKTKLLQPNELERAVDFAARRVGNSGGLLVLLDADDDCPAEKGPELWGRARMARRDLQMAVVLAKREFEAWFIASAESLRSGGRHARNGSTDPEPEALHGAKEWVRREILDGGSYSETIDQPALTARFDMVTARRRSDSFDKCYREIERLLKSLVVA